MKNVNVESDTLITNVPEMMPLNFFTGRWNTEGEIAANESGIASKIKGTDIYEWVSGGFFLLHRVDVMMGDERTEVTEIIGGYDAASNSYPMRSFDNHGTFNTMLGYFEKPDIFKIEGEGMRSTLVRSKNNNTMTVTWEQSEDGFTWKRWIAMKLTRQVE